MKRDVFSDESKKQLLERLISKIESKMEKVETFSETCFNNGLQTAIDIIVDEINQLKLSCEESNRMIIIDGWTELPPDCSVCELKFTSYYGNDYCCITGNHIIDEEKRLDSCPLKEVR